MKLEVLLSGLLNPSPAVRLDVTRVLGMLDEVRALEALREHYQKETDPTVRQAIAWAGQRLYQAQQAGYSTQAELFRHFGIDRELENTQDSTEAELIRKLQDDFDADLSQMKVRSQVKQAGMAMAAGLGMGMLAGATVGLAAAASAGLGGGGGAGLASSNLGPSDRPQIGTKRTPATAPSKADISVWVRRLRESKDPSQREQAAIELAQLNNPAALPHLAAAFMGDNAPQVRQAAQRFGKILYWSTIYWDMEQDGSLQTEMKRRLEAMGKTVTKPAPSTPEAAPPAAGAAPQTPPSNQGDIAEILRKAQQGRAERKKKER